MMGLVQYFVILYVTKYGKGSLCYKHKNMTVKFLKDSNRSGKML